jgi:hypothetical protein
MKQVRRALTAQLGGEAQLTPSQQLLIERACYLQLRCAALDGRIVDGSLTGYDNNSYVAFSNGLRRCLQALGLEGAVDARPSAMSLSDYLASKRKAPAA